MTWEEIQTRPVPVPHKHAAGLQWKRCIKCGCVNIYPLSQVRCPGLFIPCGGSLVRKVWNEHLAPRNGSGPIPLELPS